MLPGASLLLVRRIQFLKDRKDEPLEMQDLGGFSEPAAKRNFAPAPSCCDLDLEFYAGTAMYKPGPRHHPNVRQAGSNPLRFGTSIPQEYAHAGFPHATHTSGSEAPI
jgi:hypothetical protein